MKKKIMIIVWLIAILSFIPVLSFAKEDIPEYVKVGIRSGSNAVATVKLTSDTGFEFGYLSEDGFSNLYDLTDEKQLYLRKDNYFIHLNNYFYEYHYNDSQDGNNQDITGPIHIQLGDSYASKADAMAFIGLLKALDLKPFLCFDGEWKVWLGTYNTYNEAEKDLNEIKSIVSDIDLTVISKDIKRVQVLDDDGNLIFVYHPGNLDYYFVPKDNNLVTIDNKSFRGSIMVKNASNGNLTLINRVTMDEYLYGVLPKEMSYNAPIEALKAQAVVARSYAVVNIKKHKNEKYDVCAGTHCQVYGGYSSEKPSSNEGVDATSDVVLEYEGVPVSVFYHSHSGGHTENAENIWNSNQPYLIGVKDPYGGDYLWENAYTPEELSSTLKSKGYHIGNVLDVMVKDRSQFGSVLSLEFIGTQGAVALEKNDIRKVLGYTTIKSLKFYIDKGNSLCVINNVLRESQEIDSISIINKDGEIKQITSGESMVMTNGSTTAPFIKNEGSDGFHFKGNGYGHSIGMSQQGAIAMAEEGYTYTQILNHYFTNLTIEKKQ